MPIRHLPPLLVNQIAAGEIIERPASVVKELVENAIDAGARQIDIAIEQGGRELIRISDDGCGIAPEELPLALAPHATSKIERAEDLDAIATMGFRGEALASIASVSRISLRSRTQEQREAAVIEGEGDSRQPSRPAPGPYGTTITVRNLFFNTPARRKFLRTEQTEAGRVGDVVRAAALAHPTIRFTLQVDGAERMDLPPGQSPRDRVLDVLGRELESDLLELSSEERGIGLWGMIGTPAIARGTARHQYLFLNGRTISDRSVSHAVKEAYRGLIEPSRFPMFVLALRMDPAQVDVNVHPAKAEVRFRNQASVHGAVLSAIRARLRDADLTPPLEMSCAPPSFIRFGEHALPPPPAPEFSAGAQHANGGDDAGLAFVDYFRRLDPKQKGFVYNEVKQALAIDAPEVLEGEARGEDREPAREMPGIRAALSALQIHGSFIVTQDEHGLVIIDQHALHERVMFEKLRERIDHAPLEAQRLLMPATVPVEPAQIEALDRLRPLFDRLGIEAEMIGPGAIAVHSFTSLLFSRGVDPASFMQDLLHRAAGEGLADDPEAALHEILDMMACKAAIKAGDRLEPREMDELLAFRDKVERSSNCPHGRPTTLRLSIRELERQFGRR